MKKVTLIIIATEILRSKIQDKNGSWLASELKHSPLKLDKIYIVADEQEQIHQMIDLAWKTSDVVITSGGLGPTEDDLTKQVVGDYFSYAIEPSQQALPICQTNYSRRDRNYSHNESKYHHLPQNFIALNNPTGFAPGLYYHAKEEQKIIACLPGVPSEFQSMFQNEVYKLINTTFGYRPNYQFDLVIKTFGIAEEKIFKSLCPTLWNDLSQFGLVSSLPHFLGVDIGCSIAGNQAQIDQSVEAIKKKILHSPLEPYIWHIGNESIEQVIINFASRTNTSFSFAESCTGGLCASRITDFPGASKVLKGSIVSYQEQTKIELLGLTKDEIEKNGIYSTEVASLMSSNCKKIFKSTFAVGITGIAGPDGGSDQYPVGHVSIAISSEKKIYLFTRQFKGHRQELKYRFSEAALHFLRQVMQENLNQGKIL